MGENRNARIEDLLPYREEIFLLCLGFSRNAAVAEDLCQDVYVRACRKLNSIRNPEAVRIWLFRVARNICRDHHRRSRLVETDPIGSGNGIAAEPADPAPDLPGSGRPAPDDFEERLARLKSAVERLPPRLRDVFALRMYGRLTYEDVARTLRIKKGTVMSRLHRARTAVARIVNEDPHD